MISPSVEHAERNGTTSRRLGPALVYAALTSAVVSSLGMLLVPSLSAHFDIPVSTAQWMLTINLLVGAVATPIMGRLADGPNPRGLLLTCLAVIFTGSLIAAAAPNFAVFLLGRALQGLLYGIVPVTIALARRSMSELQSRPLISTLSVTVSIGMGLGYPLTGILAALIDFRAAFGFAVVFVGSAIVVVWRFVPAHRADREARVPFDLAGAVFLGLGLASLLVVVAEGRSWGWTSVPTLAVAAAAVIALGIWAVLGVRQSNPLVNLRVMRLPEVALANASAVGLGVALYIGLSISSLVAQAPPETGFGLAVPLLWAGFLMAPLSVGSFVANRAVRRLTARLDMAVFLPVGAAIMTFSAVMLWQSHSSFWVLGIGMFLFGAGVGSGYAAMPVLISRSVTIRELGSSVSFNQVLRTVGGALGASLSGAVLAAHPSGGTYSTETGITDAYLLGVGCCAVVFCALTVHSMVKLARR